MVINNAGVAAGHEHFGQFDAETMERVLRINAVAPMLVAQAVAPLLEKSGTAPEDRLHHLTTRQHHQRGATCPSA